MWSMADQAIWRWYSGYQIPGVIPINANVGRLNLVIPGLFDDWSYGGIPTALRFFSALAQEFECARLILTHQTKAQFKFDGWEEWQEDEGGLLPRSIAFVSDKDAVLSVAASDFFVGTFWTTAVWVRGILAKRQALFPEAVRRFVYLIQDYEPGFYPWSSTYVRAQSAFADPASTIPVFNSKSLAKYFYDRKLRFPESYVFEPMMHPRLTALKTGGVKYQKEKLILIYGRPSQPRNAFELLIESIRLWAESFRTAEEWTVVSAGEKHEDMLVKQDVMIESRGKISLEEYAEYLSRSWVGVCLMISPHPSYPPLEMAEFGCWAITNTFANKNLSKTVPSILSVGELNAESIAERLAYCCNAYQPGRTAVLDTPSPAFSNQEQEFPFCPELASSWRHQRPSAGRIRRAISRYTSSRRPY